ncbi:DNA/RNA non-specific endonuclease [Polaribacter sp. MSW13]|uniref:Endonuclease n=1 Tax=Polaribacter marinus TaxID=2916838 RepID=A0A9X2AIY3_9FLAO|nr:DNA/RNA non-specific endonuclease [Polaribacter marinus]MCI2228986.1 DNA/RNA non-specific endonuclease [Polaribacter marinus]
MNKRRITSLIALAVLFFIYYFQQKNKNASTIISNDIEITTDGFNYLPTSTTGQIVKHNGYTLSYSEKHEQAEWVAYSLNVKDIVYTNRKRPFFNEDPQVKTKSAHWKSYKNSGYDRGHLCPAGDRRSTKERFNETFLTSNISPQKHDFNAGIWNRLEQKTRYWAKKYNHLYVITGGVLEHNLQTIGKDKVSVPKQFYKIMLDYTQPEIKAIAFLLPHQESNKPLSHFVVSIDEVESKTGIDFFPNLPDKLEQQLEARRNYKSWGFKE